MPKRKTTSTQGYFQGAKQIMSFLKGEIGTDKDAKTKHQEYYKSFSEYGMMLNKYLDPKAGKITRKDIDDIIKKTREAGSHELFRDKNLTWKSESGIKAVSKFTTLLLENDFRKFTYYKNFISNTVDTVHMKNLLVAATPARYKITDEKIELFAKQMKKLEENLKKTEGFHVNSSEYNRMKKAIKAVNQGFKEGITHNVLGERFEELQAASMDYVMAKGVGTQSTQRGIDRMDAALDICRLAAGGMDYFMSQERINEAKQFEKNSFDIYFDYKVNNDYIKPVTSVYKEKEENEMKSEMEDDIREL